MSKLIRSAFLLLSFFTLLLVWTPSVHAQAACIASTQAACPAPFTFCSGQCCGDGVNKLSGETACANLVGNTGSNPLTDPPSKQFGLYNNALFGANFNSNFSTPRGIISVLLPFLFTFSGLILFVMLLWGGFEMLTGAANPKAQEAGKVRITAAIIGFLLIFASYWLAPILQIVFAISILK